MTIRRVFLNVLKKVEGALVSEDTEGVSGEVFDTEVFQNYGLAANPEGQREGLTLDVNDDPNNHQTLGPRGDRLAKSGTVMVYYGDDVDAVFDGDTITLRVADKTFKLEGDTVTTNMNIDTSANLKVGGNVEITGDVEAGGKIDAGGVVKSEQDVIAGTTSLKNHIHVGVMTGGGVSGPPQ